MARPAKDPDLKAIRKQVSCPKKLWEKVSMDGSIWGEVSPSTVFQEGCRARIKEKERKSHTSKAATHFILNLDDTLQIIKSAYENDYEYNGDGDGIKNAEFALARLMMDFERMVGNLDPALLKTANKIKSEMQNLLNKCE